MRGAAGLMIHDRVHGTHYWDMIKDGYYRGLEQEFVRPDGMLNFYRSARTGIGQNGACSRPTCGRWRRTSPTAAWLDMITKGMPEAWATGPQVESVPYPAVMVTRAVTDGSALDVVLRPTNGGGRHPVEVSQLRRRAPSTGSSAGPPRLSLIHI